MKNNNTRLGDLLPEVSGIDAGEIRKAQRIQQVRDIWKDLVDDIFLQHTNAVYIFIKDGTKQMHVYVDESIYAAELNARRELIKLECRQRYGEAIDSFEIHISRGKKKLEHPYRNDDAEKVDANDPVALNEKEMEEVESACAAIDDECLRYHFKKAMISDLEWKKGNRR